MTNKRTRKIINKYSFASTAGAAGAGLKFLHKILDANNLHELIEAITAADGQKAQVKRFLLTVRAYSSKPFAILPIAVQSVGVLTNTVDMDIPSIDGIIDNCCDDVFGYQNLSKVMKVAKLSPYGSEQYGIEFTIPMPSNLLQIANKEVETERLQNIYIALVGIHFNNSQSISLSTVEEMDFYGISKKIIIR